MLAWGIREIHFTVLFVTVKIQGYTDCADLKRTVSQHASLTSTYLGVLDQSLLNSWLTFDHSKHEIYFVFIHCHLCLGVSRVFVHIVTCQCVSVVSLPLFLHLLLPLDQQQTTLETLFLLLLSHHPFQLFFLFWLFPVNWNKNSPLNGLTSPFSL